MLKSHDNKWETKSAWKPVRKEHWKPKKKSIIIYGFFFLLPLRISMWDTRLSIRAVHKKMSNHSNSQICTWITTALRLKLKFVVLTQKMNHGTCREPRSSEQLSQQAGGRGQIGPCFHCGGGGSGDLKTFHWMLLIGHFKIMQANQIHAEKTSIGI